MSAAYDTYDYPSYWESREYEHKAEVAALKTLISEIPRIRVICEIGAGYGRLLSTYAHRARKIMLVDPSAKLLKLARQKHQDRKFTYVHSSVENLKSKVRTNSSDVVVLVRVIHHLKDLDKAFSQISRITKKKGYLILEYPNKRHIKEMIIQFIRGNITFPLDIFPKDLRSRKSIKSKTLPFMNYHPDYIKEKLNQYGYKTVRTLSVSNFRYAWFKKHLPLSLILSMEAVLQKTLARTSFGPSIFLLAKKVK